MRSLGRRSTVLWSLGAALAVALLGYLYLNAGRYTALLQLSPLPVLSIAALTVLGLGINAEINLCVLDGLGSRVSFRDNFLMSSTGSLANQLPVSGGIVARGVYLKRRHNFPYARFFAATVALFICSISAYGVIGLAILLCRLLLGANPSSGTLYVAFGVMSVSYMVLRLPVDRIRLSTKIRGWLDQGMEGWNLIVTNPAVLTRALAWQLILMLVLALRYWLAFHMLSQTVTFDQVMLFSAASALTQLASFAPGGLGVTEAIVGSVAASLGFPLSASVAAVALDRLVSTVVIVVSGGISSIVIGRQIADGPSDSIS